MRFVQSGTPLSDRDYRRARAHHFFSDPAPAPMPPDPRERTDLQKRVSELDAAVEVERILHEADLAFYRDALVRAAEEELRARGIDPAALAAALDLSDFPDPATVLAREDRRRGQRYRATLRRPPERQSERQRQSASRTRSRVGGKRRLPSAVDQARAKLAASKEYRRAVTASAGDPRWRPVPSPGYGFYDSSLMSKEDALRLARLGRK